MGKSVFYKQQTCKRQHKGLIKVNKKTTRRTEQIQQTNENHKQKDVNVTQEMGRQSWMKTAADGETGADEHRQVVSEEETEEAWQADRKLCLQTAHTDTTNIRRENKNPWGGDIFTIRVSEKRS